MTWFTYQDNNQRVGFEPQLAEYILIPDVINPVLVCRDVGGNILWSASLNGLSYTNAVFTLDKIYIGDDSGYLYCFDFEGNLVFSINTNGEIVYGVSVYSEAYLIVNTTGRGFIKYDLNGNELWNYLPVDMDEPIITCGFNSEGEIVEGYFKYVEGGYRLCILTLSQDGNLIWEVEVVGISYSPPTIDYYDNIYIYGLIRLYSFDSDGNERWSYTNSCEYIATPMIINDYLLALFSDSPNVVLFDLYGNIIWSFDITDFDRYSSPCKLGNDTSCFTAYSSSQDLLKMFNVDFNGNIIWSYDLTNIYDFCPSPASSSDRVYLSYIDSNGVGYFYIFDYNGNVVYEASNVEGAYTSISIYYAVEITVISLSDTFPPLKDYPVVIIVGETISLSDTLPTLIDHPVKVIPPYLIQLSDKLPTLTYTFDLKLINRIFTMFGYGMCRKGRNNQFPYNVYVSEYYGDLLILDAYLSLKYRVDLLGRVCTRASTVFLDRVFTTAEYSDGSGGGIYCSDNKGNIIWSRVDNFSCNMSPSIKIVNESFCHIFYSFFNRDNYNWYVELLDLDGNLLGRRLVESFIDDTLSSPIFFDKFIIHNNTENIYKFDYNLNLLVKYRIGTYILSCPTADGENIYITRYSSSETNFIYCFDMNLNLKWSLVASQGSSSVPAYYKEHIYVGCNDKKFRKIDKNGNVIWEFELDEKSSYSSGAVTHEGYILVPNRCYGLYWLDENGNVVIYVENSIDTGCKPTITFCDCIYYTGALLSGDGVVVVYSRRGSEFVRYVNPSLAIFSSVTYEGAFGKQVIRLSDTIPSLSETISLRSLVVSLRDTIPSLSDIIVFGRGHRDLPTLPVVIERGATIMDWHHNNQVDALKIILQKLKDKLEGF